MGEYSIPSIAQIKGLYNEIIPLLQDLKTKTDVIEFGKKHKVTMEINYDTAEKFDEKQPIEVIRCESWGDLDYIYVYPDGSTPHFDVWCDFMEYDFVDGTTIENLETNYIEGIKWLWSRCKTKPEKRKEIISILKQHGADGKEMIEVYEFEAAIVGEAMAEEQVKGDRNGND